MYVCIHSLLNVYTHDLTYRLTFHLSLGTSLALIKFTTRTCVHVFIFSPGENLSVVQNKVRISSRHLYVYTNFETMTLYIEPAGPLHSCAHVHIIILVFAGDVNTWGTHYVSMNSTSYQALPSKAIATQSQQPCK